MCGWFFEQGSFLRFSLGDRAFLVVYDSRLVERCYRHGWVLFVCFVVGGGVFRLWLVFLAVGWRQCCFVVVCCWCVFVVVFVGLGVFVLVSFIFVFCCCRVFVGFVFWWLVVVCFGLGGSVGFFCGRGWICLRFVFLCLCLVGVGVVWVCIVVVAFFCFCLLVRCVVG